MPLGPQGESLALSELKDWRILANGCELQLDWDDLMLKLRQWAATPNHVWSALTQGDPTDMNIAVPLGWYDYSTAGLNALAGEFANFCWYQAFQGGYMVPRYNPAAYRDHPSVLQSVKFNAPRIVRWELNAPTKTLIFDYEQNLAASRRAALDTYWHHVIIPVASAFSFFRDLSAIIKPYLALRIVGVFNLTELEPKDTAYSLTKLAECISAKFSFRQFFDLTPVHSMEDV
jgi:hypothetical protein